jgi:hypothetical protein
MNGISTTIASRRSPATSTWSVMGDNGRTSRLS